MQSAKITFRIIKKRTTKLFLLACLACIPAGAYSNESKTYFSKGPITINVLGGLEWMRCSIGQVWSEETCVGEPLKVPFAAATAVLERTLASSGEGWRLPTRNELRVLVQMNEEPPMINADHFPATHPGSYWTSDKNRMLANGHWVVNFYTGNNYGRAARSQSFAIRLVRDR